MKVLLFIILIFISSCRAALIPEVNIKEKQPLSPVVYLSTTCYSADDKCKKSFEKNVHSVLINELQFQGFKIVKDKKDSNGVILTTINMLTKAMSENWFIEVQIEYRNNDKSIWVTKCKHESYWTESNSWSIEEATRCAINGYKNKIKNKKFDNQVSKVKEDYPIMLKIKSNLKISDDFRDGVEEVLTSMGYYLIDEKTQEEALKQQEEQSKSDCYDDTCLVDTGKMLAAKALIVVEVEKKSENSYKFKARFIDFEKGATIKSTSSYFEFSLKNYKEIMDFGRILTKNLLK